jgi:hypothetical protein
LRVTDALKLTYSNVGVQKFSGVKPPDPPLQKGAVFNAAGGGASNAEKGRGGAASNAGSIFANLT